MNIIQLGWVHGKAHPPERYGGIERMVATLSVELARQGHTVTMIAPAGSHAVGCDVIECNNFVEATNIIATLRADVVHDHSCWMPESPVRQGLKTPFLSTTHVNHAVGWSKNVVYLSASQRKEHGIQLGFYGRTAPVIYVPINPDLKPLGIRKEDFLLCLGSIQPYKGVLAAAEVAEYLGRKLLVAGPMSNDDYFESVLKHRAVEYVGEIGDPERSELLEQARAVMCLHNNTNGWHEPGCGVVGEAMAFNTPVAALSNGCLPEMVFNNHNGWMADNEFQISRLIDNPVCQPTDLGMTIERNTMSVERIATQYVELYEKVTGGFTWG